MPTPSRKIPSPPTCETYTARHQLQEDLQSIGVGASSQVYNVSDKIVLKAPWIYERPSPNASARDQWVYDDDTIFHYNLLRNERVVLQILQKHPHPNIIQAVDTAQPEGVYLRKYRPLSADTPSTQTQAVRTGWYCAITDALRHLHGLGIIHADVRIDNVLFDESDSPILCDFSAASPVGYETVVPLDPPLPLTGPSPTLCEASDMFAMASLIFRMECGGVKAELCLQGRRLVLPEIQSGNAGLDDVIRKAWLGGYNCTFDMLSELRALCGSTGQELGGTARRVSEPNERLQEQIDEWRSQRLRRFGKSLLVEELIGDYCCFA